MHSSKEISWTQAEFGWGRMGRIGEKSKQE